MQYLADSFELIDSHIPHQGRAWRLVKPLSGEKIARLGTQSLQAEERLALLDGLIARSEQVDLPFLETVRVWQISLDGDANRARAELARLQQLYGFEQRDEFWAVQAREIGAYLQTLE